MGEAYEPRSGCPINATIEVSGDRWSLLVLRDIVFGERAISESCRPAQKRGSPQYSARLTHTTSHDSNKVTRLGSAKDRIWLMPWPVTVSTQMP
jgi:hypothetical protein